MRDIRHTQLWGLREDPGTERARGGAAVRERSEDMPSGSCSTSPLESADSVAVRSG